MAVDALSALIGGTSQVLAGALKTAPAGPQRADGYALGGMADGDALGAAYGGAYSQANVDGSNWTVATSGSTASAEARSGGNGGLAIPQSYGAITDSRTPTGAAGSSGGFSLGVSPTMLMVMAGVGLVAILLLRR
jgi:hypothetical protein